MQNSKKQKYIAYHNSNNKIIPIIFIFKSLNIEIFDSNSQCGSNFYSPNLKFTAAASH